MKKYRIIVHVMTLIMLSFQISKAQLNPLSAQYYNNLYLANPAFAGYEKGLTVNAAYKRQWGSIPGAPIVQNLTVDYSKKKAAMGLNVNFDRAGLQRQSRVVGTYAYHLPLNSQNSEMHFGVSLGFMNQRLANSDIIGNGNDPLAMAYNQRQTYIDGDFGVAYTTQRFKVEAAVPNLKTFFKREEIQLANVGTFYTAVSYKVELSEGIDGMELEPKFAYRGFKGVDNIWDLGTQLTLANRQIMLTGIYHSVKSASFGLGLDYKRKYLINGFYTTQTSSLNSYSNGTFEINVKGRF
ncbi:type IX secretion system membrane protein PorP/SprF [Pedobacter polaris]|uniref:Type IX secretion system membrane protein PorP/SprF n=1 Tax=Pedobacter polaris TaxID=2571273 RepID=A0A4U1CXE0_9SPHI|nr:PorP/SprF family type IX secretion system membrane protein [Pedobacter polaris]TKC10778.1 type IX secretion system membrane protein PorP/SprF [Pedobacter polaris]